MNITKIDTENTISLSLSANTDRRSTILISLLPAEPVSLIRASDTDYIQILNKFYSNNTYDLAPYHYFIQPSEHCVTIFENKDIHHRLSFVDSRSAYKDDISIMIMADRIQDLSKANLLEIGTFLGELSAKYTVMANELTIFSKGSLSKTSAELNNYNAIIRQAIAVRNNIIPPFAACEGLKSTIRSVTFDKSDNNLLINSDDVKDMDYISVTVGDKLLSLGEDYALYFDSAAQKYVIALNNGTESDIQVNAAFNSSIVINNTLRIYHGIDSETYRRLVREKVSMSEEQFQKLNPHIYSETHSSLEKEYFLLPAAMSSFPDYVILNAFKAGERIYNEAKELFS